MRNRALGIFVLWLISTSAAMRLAHPASRYPARGPHGMVVSVSSYASDIGIAVLKEGGHAVDAAVAVGFALAVVHPQAGNLGGGGFMVIHDTRQATETTFDYREMAPAGADRDMYLDPDGKVVEDLSTVGHLASGVPGSVAGLHAAWKKYGRLEWSRLIEPAIQLARRGFVVNYPLSQSLRAAQKLLERFPESQRIFLKEGRLFEEGERLLQPDLAQTLELISRQGPSAFYEGKIAQKIVEEMQAGGGLITLADLKGYRAVEREPVRGTYRGYEIVSMGPPSSGGVILVEMLNMLEIFPVRQLGFHSSEHVHLLAEIMKRAFADRAQYLGDSDFSPVPVQGLTSKAYARNLAESISRQWAATSDSIGNGNPYAYESPDTTHYSVVDSEGNAVSATTTINGSYGSGVTVRGTGFLLNNEMDDFVSKPGVPNAYGLIQGEANSIGPGKRPLSAMTPTLVKEDGKLLMVVGSPGGPTIINTVFQIISNVLDFEQGIQQAVDAPRVHHQWLPDRIIAETDAIVRDVEMELLRRGHRIDRRSKIGDAHSILIEPGSGVRLGAPDPRVGESKASGY